jgi:membrane dipeptidase
MKQGNALAQFFAIYIPRIEMKIMDPYDIFLGIYKTYQKELANNIDAIRPAYCVTDIIKNEKNGKMSALLSIEDGVVVGDKMKRIDEFFNKGVRMMTLTWNYENSIGFPCSDNPDAHKQGLKPFGIDAVRRMNELGMIVDVSHLSESGFYDVAAHSSQPFVASHSCAKALCNHRRNLSDEQLKVLGEKCGLVGVNFCANFLREGSQYATVEEIVQHTVHMVNKAGLESVGLGSDFDGIETDLEMEDYCGYPSLVDALSKHFNNEAIEKICYKNALRVLSQCKGYIYPYNH